MTTTKQNPFGTHYVPSGHRADMVYAFNLDECEMCGVTLIAPNAVHVGREAVAMFNMRRVKRVPPELYWNENLGMAVCPDCDRTNPDHFGDEEPAYADSLGNELGFDPRTEPV